MGLTRNGKKGSVRRATSSEGFGSASTYSNTSSFGSLADLGNDNGVDDLGNISVVVRVRPLSEREIQRNDDTIIQVVSHEQIMMRPDVRPNGQSALSGAQSTFNQTLTAKTFTFNSVFDQTATQSEMMDKSGVAKVIAMAMEGYSTTIFCYGQTGSGKTHTLTGPPHLFQDKPNPFSEEHGLIYRAFVHLFDRLKENTKSDCTYIIKASFLEIYNEKVIDLLNLSTFKKPLQVRWSRASGGFYVENLFTVECEEFDDLLAVLEEGMRNRAVGSHGMNDYSSRSHTILTVHVISELQASEEGVYLSRHGKINFVDLAGSEMTKKTNSQGKTLEEANNINKSLMVLGYCISQLSDPRKRNGHIPYRDSKLTQLLSDSLAGNGITLMVACVSPARSNLSETLNTLRYAARAKHIRNKPVVVMDPREALILSLKRAVMALQEENVHLRNLIDLEKSSSQQPERPLTAVIRSSSTEQVLLSGAATDTPRFSELPAHEAHQLLHSLLQENRALRKENADLYSLREALLRQQEAVTKHNERLIKQIEGKPIRTSQPIMTFLSPDGPSKIEPTNGGSVSARTSPLPQLKRSNSLTSISGRSSLANPLSQSVTLLNQQSPTMGLNGTGILPMEVSREMTKRGFNASKSADSRTSNDIAR
ncbi:kinesin-like protein KIF12 [Daphnia magna]|uniref:kinesin-like protein KIF12 n=1 Tax=Daphnia magna TaxID=35525 RepID=UPI001E1BDBC5|nr:kinesin-like protein KIF12 [Daphnia magna]